MSISEMKKHAAQPEKDVTLYLGDILRGIQKFWLLSVVFVLLCSGIAACWNYVRFVPLYQASATFTVLTQNETLSGNGSQSAYSFSYNRTTAERLAIAFQYASQSGILQKKVCEDLGTSVMPASLTVNFSSGTNLMTISAFGQDPQQVCAVLYSFAEHYSDVTTYIVGPTKLVTIAEPEFPSEPYNAQSWKTAAAKAAVFGLAVGAAWVVLYAIFRQTVRAKADIRQELNQTCIGVLPQVTFKRYKRRMNTRILLTNPAVGGDFLESLRLLRDAVQNGLSDKEKVVLITSTAPEEGKSVITLNLAAIIAKTDKRVLVLDADLRHSGISELLYMDGTQVSAEMSENTSAVRYRIQTCPALGIDVLTFNTQAHHIRQIIRTDQMREVIDALRARYDLILIDTPPCGMISDTAIIAGASDAAVYVVRQDTVLTSRIRNGINTLLATDIRLVGCILNCDTAGFGSCGYYYGYGGYRVGHRRAYAGKYSARHQDRAEKNEL